MVLCLFLRGHMLVHTGSHCYLTARRLGVEFRLGLLCGVWMLGSMPTGFPLKVHRHAHRAKWWWTRVVDSFQDRAAHTWCCTGANGPNLSVSLSTTTQFLLQQLLYPVMRPAVSTAPATVIGMNMTVSSEIYYSVRRLLKLGTKAIV